jgi:hypothetical protein
MYNKDLHKLYHSQNIIRVIKSRRMRWADMGQVRNANILTINMRGRDNLEDPALDGRILLKCIKKRGERAWTGFIWLKIQPGGGR